MLLPSVINSSFESLEYDKDPNAWEVFAVGGRPGHISTVRFRPGVSGDIASWLSQANYEDMAEQYGRINILCARHNDQHHKEVSANKMAFDPKTLRKLFADLELPMQYFTLLSTTSASGGFTWAPSKSNTGDLERLTAVLRVPHRPDNQANAIWSMALSWNAATKSTCCFMVGASDEDIELIIENLNMLAGNQEHPFAFVSVLFGILIDRYTKMRRTCDYDVFEVEAQAGLREKFGTTLDPFQWSRSGLQSMNILTHATDRNLVYMERRIEFAKHAFRCFIFGLTYLQKELNGPSLLKTNETLQREAENTYELLTGQAHQLTCLRERIKTINSMLSSIVAQQAPRVDIGVAAETKRDSSSLITIAFLTAVFLPPTYVAALFGTNMFDIIPKTSNQTLSNEFWLYWVITIPLTLIVLAIWWIWMRHRHQKTMPWQTNPKWKV